MKKLLFLLIVLLMMSGCDSSLGHLKTKEDETVIYNITNGFNVMDVLDVKDNVDVKTELDKENSELIITLTKGDKTETLYQKVEIQEPLALIEEENIVINAYDIDVFSLLSDVREGTDIAVELDEDTSELKVT